MARKDKEIKLRIINAVFSLLLLSAIIYALVASFDLIAISLISTSLIGTAIPIVLTVDGIVDIIIGILEALLEGLIEIVAGIADAISSVFS